MEMKNQNNIEHQYLKLLKDILNNGTPKQTRNGDTISVFGRQIRHDMKLGFPLLTTKKMAWKSIVTELLWFLRGDTNIKFLVDNGCHIWDGDCYQVYLKEHSKNPNETAGLNDGTPFNKSEFIALIQSSNAFAKKWGELGPVYGKQWRKWNCLDEGFVNLKEGEEIEVDLNCINISHQVDQIANLISELKTNPDSRRLMVNAWNVGELDQMVLPPCHFSFQCYIRELSLNERFHFYVKRDNPLYPLNVADIDKYLTLIGVPTRAISLMWNQRSVDTPLGLPFNIASYALLLEIIGKIVNMVPDELIGNLGDTHIYHNQVDGIKEQLTREPYQLPKLNINTEWWPTESGECGEGPIDAQAVLEGFSNDNFCKCLIEEDIQLGNYKYHPTIKMPLSN
jgi:thymidylate synthase